MTEEKMNELGKYFKGKIKGMTSNGEELLIAFFEKDVVVKDCLNKTVEEIISEAESESK